MHRPDFHERRYRAAILLLWANGLVLVVALVVSTGPFGLVRGHGWDEVGFGLLWGGAPLVLAGLTTWLARHSWEGTSWLFGSWACLLIVSIPAHGSGDTGGIISFPAWFILAILQGFWVAGSAAVAFVVCHLHFERP